MSFDDIRKHLSVDQKHILKFNRSNPISVGGLFELFKWYLKFNSTDELEIGDIRDSYKGLPWIWVQRKGTLYHINGDTKLKGIQEFFLNRNREWSVIETQTGNLSKITNEKEGKPIEGFYMYKI